MTQYAWSLLCGVSLVELPGQWLQTFYFVVGPMLMLMGLGYVIQRRRGLDMPTLVQLNFYFVIPAIIYFSIVSSQLTLADVGKVFSFHITLMLLLAGLTLTVARFRKVATDRINAMLMTVIFYNSGNYGLPLQDLAYRSLGRSSDAMGLQVCVMLLQNMTGFSIGIVLAAMGGKGSTNRKKIAGQILKFPPLYALTLGLMTLQVRSWLGEEGQVAGYWLRPFWETLVTVKNAYVAVALLTLGAQLATLTPQVKDRYPIKLSVVLRLLVAPAMALLLIHLIHWIRPGTIDPFLAQVMFIASGTPTALNAMLLCLEFDNHPDYLARAVFYSTLVSPFSITLIVFLAQSGLLAPLRMGAGM